MQTAQRCQEALQKLTTRLAELDPADREGFFAGRSFSCRVPDLDVTFATRFGAAGAGDVRTAPPGEPAADVRLTADSDTVVELADDIGAFPRALVTGRVKVKASMRDLLRLRKLL